KRTRASKACDTCRRKRTKCSGEYPCSGCKAFGFSCHYSITTKRRGPVRKNTIKTLENRLKVMESLLAA
ncbi:nuclear protein, partial [Phlyctochytrium arcticum]